MAGRRGGDDAADRGAMLKALEACRSAIVREMPNMKPIGPLYHFASGVLAAIDGLATFLTRGPTFFHDKGTTGRSSTYEGEERDRQIGRGGGRLTPSRLVRRFLTVSDCDFSERGMCL